MTRSIRVKFITWTLLSIIAVLAAAFLFSLSTSESIALNAEPQDTQPEAITDIELPDSPDNDNACTIGIHVQCNVIVE